MRAVVTEIRGLHQTHDGAGGVPDVAAGNASATNCGDDSPATSEAAGRPSLHPGPRRRVIEALAAELLRWLPAHVGEMDRALAVFRFRERTGGAPVRIARVPH
jgi:hypothetical protein